MCLLCNKGTHLNSKFTEIVWLMILKVTTNILVYEIKKKIGHPKKLMANNQKYFRVPEKRITNLPISNFLLTRKSLLKRQKKNVKLHEPEKKNWLNREDLFKCFRSGVPSMIISYVTAFQFTEFTKFQTVKKDIYLPMKAKMRPFETPLTYFFPWRNLW